MTIFKYHIVKRAYGNRFYLLPRKLTLYVNPPIYAWGYWNICKININLDSWV